MKKYIYSSDKDEIDDGFDDSIKDIKDDYDYVMEGLDKLHRSESGTTMDLVKNLSDFLQGMIISIANNIEDVEEE